MKSEGGTKGEVGATYLLHSVFQGVSASRPFQIENEGGVKGEEEEEGVGK
jgi:hypothetical protein